MAVVIQIYGREWCQWDPVARVMPGRHDNAMATDSWVVMLARTMPSVQIEEVDYPRDVMEMLRTQMIHLE